jgi:hypothetical protein
MAFDLDYTEDKRMDDAWMMFQLLTTRLRVTETFILATGENNGFTVNGSREHLGARAILIRLR